MKTDIEVDLLRDTLDNLSSRNHVISDEAIHAKRHLDEEKFNTTKDLNQRIERQQQLIEEFNVSIKLLTEVFRQTKFDAVIGLAINPTRMLLLNFCIGIFRGIGFATGLLLLSGLLFYFFGEFFVALF